MAASSPATLVPTGHREVGGGRDYTIHGYTSPGLGSVNAYWIETAHSVLVFDTLRRISEARLALAEVKRLGKPIRGIVLSHAHPDHVGGLGVFAAAAGADVPIYGSAITRESIATDALGYRAMARRLLRDDFPQTTVCLNRMVGHDEHLDLDGLTIHFHQFGPCETGGMTGLDLGDGQMLVADLLANGMTPFLLEGRTLSWLGTLSTLGTALPHVRQVHPGHGPSSDLEPLLEAQIAYLSEMRDLILDNIHPAGGFPEAGRKAVVAGMERRYRGWLPVAEMPDLLAMNADAFAHELAAEASA